MFTKSIVAVAVLTIVSSLTTIANAKAKRPVVCFEFTEATMPVDGVPQKVALCTDGKKPQVLTSYQVTSLKNEDGVSVKAAIGYR